MYQNEFNGISRNALEKYTQDLQDRNQKLNTEVEKLRKHSEQLKAEAEVLLKKYLEAVQKRDELAEAILTLTTEPMKVGT